MYEEIRNNKIKSWVLIFSFAALVVGVAYVSAGFFGLQQYTLTFAVSLSLILTLIGYYKSDKISLALNKAIPADEKKYKHLHNVVEGLSIAAGLPKPKVYIIRDRAMNAFATGRNPENSAIAVTTGLLENLKRVELEGVIAHEISHIKNYDIRFSTLVGVMVGVVAILVDITARGIFWGNSGKKKNEGIFLIFGIVALILAPIIANLMRFALSRRREYLADSTGALLTRYPNGLADALEKISKDKHQLKSANHSTAHLFISKPFKNSKKWLNSMFSTHPPIEERIRILRRM